MIIQQQAAVAFQERGQQSVLKADCHTGPSVPVKLEMYYTVGFADWAPENILVPTGTAALVSCCFTDKLLLEMMQVNQSTQKAERRTPELLFMLLVYLIWALPHAGVSAYEVCSCTGQQSYQDIYEDDTHKPASLRRLSTVWDPLIHTVGSCS